MLKWISDAIHRSFLRRDVKLKADSLAVVEVDFDGFHGAHHLLGSDLSKWMKMNQNDHFGISMISCTFFYSKNHSHIFLLITTSIEQPL